MKKILPYLYFAFGLIILIDGFKQFFEDKSVYRILFNWTTESKVLYLTVKTAFACLFFFGGFQKLKQLR